MALTTNTGAHRLSAGKWRHLSQCATTAGHFVILALDHRANLRSALDQASEAPVTDAAFSAFKDEAIRAMLPPASALLTDPDFGLRGFFAAPDSGRRGLLLPLEVTDYTTHASQRATNFIEGWSVSQVKNAGASGVKLLLYYHPKAPNASGQRMLAAQLIEQCRLYEIPLFLEPITYSPDPSRSLTSAELRQVVIDSAHTFGTMGADVIKTEFPLDVTQDTDEKTWRAALAELNAACPVPWALLSAGVDYTTFKRQATLACEAGASGVIVGRALWAEAVTRHGAARTAFLETEGCARLEELAAICAQSAVDWRTRVTAPPLEPGWYKPEKSHRG